MGLSGLGGLGFRAARPGEGQNLTPSRTPHAKPRKALPIHPLWWWDWATWRAENVRRRRHRLHSTHRPRLLSPALEGNVPSGRHPDPTKRPLWELEVRTRGRRDSWVRVPAHCQSPGCWANISGIKRSAGCPARPPELDAAVGALSLHCLSQGL